MEITFRHDDKNMLTTIAYAAQEVRVETRRAGRDPHVVIGKFSEVVAALEYYNIKRETLLREGWKILSFQ